MAVEPGGSEAIGEGERHGRPRQLWWTWTSSNLEFATIFVGVLAVGAYRMNFWQAVAAIVIGTGLGAAAHGVLSGRGPAHGVPQMVLWAGLVSFLIGLTVSVLLFCNQQKFVGLLARMFPQLGDVTFFVGFLVAGGCYLLLSVRLGVSAWRAA